MHSSIPTLITERHPDCPHAHVHTLLTPDPNVSVLAAVPGWAQTRCRRLRTTRKSQSRFKDKRTPTFYVINFSAVSQSPGMNQNQSDTAYADRLQYTTTTNGSRKICSIYMSSVGDKYRIESNQNYIVVKIFFTVYLMYRYLGCM